MYDVWWTKSYLSFRHLVHRDKKLSHGSGDKNLGVCPVYWLPVCPIPKTILKSKTKQLKLSCQVPYFLADQTHPYLQMLLLISVSGTLVKKIKKVNFIFNFYLMF
jgi:hypothetical protein